MADRGEFLCRAGGVGRRGRRVSGLAIVIAEKRQHVIGAEVRIHPSELRGEDLLQVKLAGGGELLRIVLIENQQRGDGIIIVDFLHREHRHAFAGHRAGPDAAALHINEGGDRAGGLLGGVGVHFWHDENLSFTKLSCFPNDSFSAVRVLATWGVLGVSRGFRWCANLSNVALTQRAVPSVEPAPVAQWIEHGSPKAGVGGSIPLWGALCVLGLPGEERLKGCAPGA